MFREVELERIVPVLAESCNSDKIISQRSIVTQLLEGLLREKACKNCGYFLSVTGLKRIGEGQAVEQGNLIFPVVFKCRTFLPLKGEIFQGVVTSVLRLGVFLRFGPIKYAFLCDRKMHGYQFVSGENPSFVNDEHAEIKKDVVVRFKVLDVRWVEKREGRVCIRKEFMMLATIDGDSLGPISLCESDELDL
ncbi:hypothetical protein UlMin_042098 [Ulmus minor]